MQIICNRTTQLVIDVNENMIEEIMEMSEEELLNKLTDIAYDSNRDLGEISNMHGKVECELLDDENKSIRYFENYGDD